MAKPRTLFQKIWDDHLVDQKPDGSSLIYIDRHMVHEVTSPQAFEGLRQANRRVRRVGNTLSVPDHNVPTTNRHLGIRNPESATQLKALAKNVVDFDVPYIDLMDSRQGIVHIVGPEQGFSIPGMTMVCGDSHTATHGAFGALAFGIGTSEVEHVLATQTLIQNPAKSMRITVNGTRPIGVTAKDITLAIIGKIGTGGATGHVIEYAGDAIRSLSMEGRMTVCNMAIEAGARAGMIAPDQTTYDYIKGRPLAPKGELWKQALAYWKTLPSDPGAVYDREIHMHIDHIHPMVTWGTSPEDVVAITDVVPAPSDASTADKADAMERSLHYMGLTAGTPMTDISIDRVFIGSCTNSRIEDLREVAKIVQGRKVADNVHAMVVPGSGLIRQQAEEEGIANILKESGFEWRDAGCSMCLAMNDDKAAPYERCASTSNRNFEGRQGRDSRTHLMSPAMAAAAAITGRLTDVREFL